MLVSKLRVQGAVLVRGSVDYNFLLHFTRQKSTNALTTSKYWRNFVAGSTRCMILFGAVFFGSLESVYLLTKFIRNPRQFFLTKQREKPPAITTDPRYGQHKIAKLKDVSLHYVENGKRGAPLVLMVHGWPECWWSWRHQLTRLADKHYAVAFDMRGFCDSSKPKGIESYRVRNIVEDVRSMVEHLGYKQCVVMGHDWGGVAAWQFAMRYPSMVQKLIVLNCPHPAIFSRALFNIRHWPFLSYQFYFQLPYLPELSCRFNDFERFKQLHKSAKYGIPDDKLMTADDLEMFKYAFSKPDALTATINYYRSQFSFNSLQSLLVPSQKGTPASSARLRTKLEAPTLILWGKQDKILTSEMATASLSYCQTAEIRFFEKASHWLQQHEPEAVNEAIVQFLDRK